MIILGGPEYAKYIPKLINSVNRTTQLIKEIQGKIDTRENLKVPAAPPDHPANSLPASAHSIERSNNDRALVKETLHEIVVDETKSKKEKKQKNQRKTSLRKSVLVKESLKNNKNKF